jgi:PAT family beta-lactamase induction signal transducer AmpG
MTDEKKRPSLWELLKDIATDRRLALMLALGYSSGLPFLLIFSTHSAWLAKADISVKEVGLFSLVALPFSFKFLWAPIIDTRDLPMLTPLLGRRRAWMLLAQLCVVGALICLSFGDPAHNLTWNVVFAFALAFCAASQDIVIDAWRIDAAPPERQGMMSATSNLGYRFGLICAGAGALYIADFVSWKAAYLTMACLMAIGIAGNLLAPRPPSAPATAPARLRQRPKFASIFVEPLADLWQRKGPILILILVLVALYRLPDFLSGVLANKFYITLGFSLSDIATMSKLYGVWIGIIGAFCGGFVVSRFGLMPALLIGGIAASASHLSLALLAASGARLDLLMLSVSVESFAGNFAGMALIAYMSSLTSPLFAATQYALLSSLYALPGKFVGSASGFMVEAFGYPFFFVLTSMIGIPVVLLCLVIWPHHVRNEKAAAAGQEATVAESKA